MRIILFTLAIFVLATTAAVAQSQDAQTVLQHTLDLSEMERCMQAGQVTWAIFQNGRTEALAVQHKGQPIPWYTKPDAFMRKLPEEHLIRIGDLQVTENRAWVRLKVGPCELNTRFERIDGHWQLTEKSF